MKTLLAGILALTLGGCATCQQHPVYCAVGTAIIVGSAVAIAEQHGHGHGANCGPARADGRQSAFIGCEAN